MCFRLRRETGGEPTENRRGQSRELFRVLGRFGRLASLFAEPDFVGDQMDQPLRVRLECGVVLEIVPHKKRLASLPTTLLIVEE